MRFLQAHTLSPVMLTAITTLRLLHGDRVSFDFEIRMGYRE
jgi:hypothetical protein